MKNRLLFLDIDGVVNTIMISDKPIEDTERGKIKREGFYFDLCHPKDKRVSNRQAILWISKLCLDYKLDIVITSTWLIGHKLEEIKECLYNSGLSRNISIIDGCFHNMFSGRGIQIENWMVNNKIKEEDSLLLILDDDSDMIGFNIDLTKYLIKTFDDIGFTHREYIKAIELLDKQVKNF